MVCPDKNQLNKKVNKELTKVEKYICGLVDLWYPGLKVMVSIQVLRSSQEGGRDNPCNKMCKAIQKDDANLALCNMSDMVMKDFLSDQIQGKWGQQKKMMTVGYRCHKYLSNLLTPVRHNFLGANYNWYIFVGQFFLQGCCKRGVSLSEDVSDLCSKCLPDCPCGFESEKIRILRESDVSKMNKDDQKCVRPGLYYDPSCIKEKYDVSFVTIPQLLICKYIATSTFERFLKRMTQDPEKSTLFQSWLKIYGDEKEEDQSGAGSWGSGPTPSAAFT